MTILRCPVCGEQPDTLTEIRLTPMFTEVEASALIALHISVAHVTARSLMALLPHEEPRTSE